MVVAEVTKVVELTGLIDYVAAIGCRIVERGSRGKREEKMNSYIFF